jgi:hypothetical protein
MHTYDINFMGSAALLIHHHVVFHSIFDLLSFMPAANISRKIFVSIYI